MGILGEYIAHIYMEVKDRPIFVMQNTNFDLDTIARKNGDK